MEYFECENVESQILGFAHHGGHNFRVLRPEISKVAFYQLRDLIMWYFFCDNIL